jgi:hypothetical protein
MRQSHGFVALIFLPSLLAAGCAVNPDLPWPREAGVADLRTCYAIDTAFAFYADRFEDEHERKLMGRPLPNYSFLHSFGYLLPSRGAHEPAFAKLVPTDRRDKMRIDVYSYARALIYQLDLRTSRIVECGPEKTVLVYEGDHAAEGTRTHYRYTVTYSKLNRHVRAESQVTYTSGWLVFKGTERWQSWAEFRTEGPK